jgi:predicted lactoylglutathione lyase
LCRSTQQAQTNASTPFYDGAVKVILSVSRFFESFDNKQDRITDKNINTQLLTAISCLTENTTPATGGIT